MLKSIEMTGANRDQAIEKALRQLGLDRDDVSVEVLDNGKKGFLGIGATDARVRITYEVPDEEVKSEVEPKEEIKPETTEVEPQKEEKKEPEKQPKAANIPNFSDIAPDDPRLTTPHLVKAAPKKAEGEAPKKQENEEKKANHEPIVPYIEPVPMAEELVPENAKEAVKFVQGLLEKMGIEGTATVISASEPDHIRIDIAGEDMGPVIGRRGDTLDAIQYLTSLVINKSSEEHIRLTIDTENYRAKRAESLERLARKMAVKVSRYHKAMTLEPMNPYERRIIHASLQNFRGVTTYSTGTEPNRRVVIAPDAPARPPRKGYKK